MTTFPGGVAVIVTYEGMPFGQPVVIRTDAPATELRVVPYR